MNALGRRIRGVRPLLPAIQKTHTTASNVTPSFEDGDITKRRRGRSIHSKRGQKPFKGLGWFRVITFALLLALGVMLAASFGSAPFLPLPFNLFPEMNLNFWLPGPAKTRITFDSATELDVLNNQPSERYCKFKAPLCCAHGGDVDAGPPNTCLSFISALRAGCNCLEVDVSMTRDGRLVALHDRDLGKLKKVASPHVGDYTWAQLASLRWPRSNESIVLVRDILHSVLLETSVELIILDVKLREGVEEESESKVMARAVHDVLQTAGCGQKCIVWAKYDGVAVSIKDINRDQIVGRVIVNDTESARASGMQYPWRNRAGVAEVAGLHWEMALPDFVSHLYRPPASLPPSTARYQRVIVWTANTAAMMIKALESTADAIVTSHPRKLLSAIRSRRLECDRRRKAN
jgi:glycerophosphoryl diester phosphodiesterase